MGVIVHIHLVVQNWSKLISSVHRIKSSPWKVRIYSWRHKVGTRTLWWCKTKHLIWIYSSKRLGLRIWILYHLRLEFRQVVLSGCWNTFVNQRICRHFWKSWLRQWTYLVSLLFYWWSFIRITACLRKIILIIFRLWNSIGRNRRFLRIRNSPISSKYIKRWSLVLDNLLFGWITFNLNSGLPEKRAHISYVWLSLKTILVLWSSLWLRIYIISFEFWWHNTDQIFINWPNILGRWKSLCPN